MQNNLYNQINQNNFGAFGNLVNKFNELWSSAQGDPNQAVQQLVRQAGLPQNMNTQGGAEQIVQQLMMNGIMSQQQFNFFNNMAIQFRTFLKR